MPNEQKVTRKLRAIMSADVKGYPILMANDAFATIQTLKKYRNIMSACTEQHGDRIFGDGVNVAARIEGVADAGGVCISKTTFKMVCL